MNFMCNQILGEKIVNIYDRTKKGGWEGRKAGSRRK
jgi:hypothetical protein